MDSFQTIPPLTPDEVLERYVGQFGLGQLQQMFFIVCGDFLLMFLMFTIYFVDKSVILTDKDVFTCTADASTCATVESDPNRHFCPLLYDTGSYYFNHEYSSPATQFNLVCDRAWRVPFEQCSFYFCVLSGSLAFGYLGDWKGRKFTFLVAVFVVTITSGVSAAMPTYWAYWLFRSLSGLCAAGIEVSSQLLMLEWCGPQWKGRGFLIQASIIFLTDGILPFIDLACQYNWHYFLGFGTLFFGLLAFGSFFVLESPRWLVTVNREAEARTLMEVMGRRNNREVPADLQMMVQEEEIGLKEVFKRFNPTLWLVVLAIINLSSALLQVGNDLTLAEGGGSYYVDYSIMAWLTLPGYVLFIFAIDYIGRGPCVFILLLIGSSGAIARAMLNGEASAVTETAVSVFVQLGSFTVQEVGQLYVAEMYPTGVRGRVAGIIEIAQFLGMMLGPLLNYFVVTNGSLFGPLIAMAVLGYVSACLVLVLPETNKKRQPETVEEMEKLFPQSITEDFLHWLNKRRFWRRWHNRPEFTPKPSEVQLALSQTDPEYLEEEEKRGSEFAYIEQAGEPKGPRYLEVQEEAEEGTEFGSIADSSVPGEP